MNGLIIDGRVFELSSGGCFRCSLQSVCREGEELCIGFPYPDPDKDNCFRYSPNLTEKLNKP